MKHKIHSIGEIRQALSDPDIDPLTVMIRAEDFFRQAASAKSVEVKNLLIDIVREIAGTAVAYAIAWLAEYRDPDMLPFFVELLEDDEHRLPAIFALMQLDDPLAIEPLLKYLPIAREDERDAILSALGQLKALNTLDKVAGYLNHPKPATRISAMLSLLNLVQVSGERELAKKVFLLLEDPVPQVRLATSTRLEIDFPDILSTYNSTIPSDQ